jgi:fructose transport system permease protein
VVLMLALYLLSWLVLRETAPWPPCVRGGQQPRSHPPDRHFHREGTVLGVYVLAGLFYGIAAIA